MPNMTDNDLDKIFREAADRNMPEFDPQGWEDMARRLEHEERAAAMRSKSLYTLLAILFIYALLPPWGHNGNTQHASVFQTSESTEVAGEIKTKESGLDKEIITNPATEESDKNDRKVVEKVEEEFSAYTRIDNSIEEDANSNLNKKAISKPALENTDLDNSNKTLDAVEQRTKKSDNNIDNKAIIKPAVGPVNVENNIKETSDALTQTDNGAATGISVIDAGGSLNQKTPKLSQTDNDDLIVSEGEAIGSVNEGFKEADRAKNTILYNRSPHERIILMAQVADADSVIKPIEQGAENPEQPVTVVRPDRLTSSPRWFLKVPVSPDFSAIDYNKLGETGINIGLLGEYNLTDHLSVSTGAIWSKKLYDSKNPDKSYTSGNWTGKASRLDGDCRILDIPINVTYYIFPHRRTSLFVSIGSSSYIMLKEQYVYTVWANQQEYQYEENFSHKNNEWFSMLNLSIGIQQRLGKRFFAQAEPFLKAPVSGVGEGKVNLMSTGIFLSLKYSLNK